MKFVKLLSFLLNKSNFFSTIVLSTFCLNIPNVSASPVLDLNQKIWQMETPSIPSVNNSGTYLPIVNENIVSSRVILDLAQSKLDVYKDNKLVASFTIITVGVRCLASFSQRV